MNMRPDLNWNMLIKERPADPVDMGLSVDPVSGTFVLWSIGDDGVAHIEVLSTSDYAGGDDG